MKVLVILGALFMIACRGPQGDTGQPGIPGTPGTPGTVIAAEPFCPNIPGVVGYENRESYIRIDSSIYAVYFDKKHTFLALLNPGTYTTTDGRNCVFIVTAEGEVL